MKAADINLTPSHLAPGSIGIIFFKNLGLISLLELKSDDFLSLEGVLVGVDLDQLSLSWTTYQGEDYNTLIGSEWQHLLEVIYPPEDMTLIKMMSRARKPSVLRLHSFSGATYQKRRGSPKAIESHSNKGGPIEVHHLLVLRSDQVLERDCSGGNWTLEQMVKEFLRSQKLGTLGI